MRMPLSAGGGAMSALAMEGSRERQDYIGLQQECLPVEGTYSVYSKCFYDR